jgi:CTP:molybdopterin cytidylyltransferase MocA
MNLQDNQTAAKLYSGDNPEVTKDDLKHLLQSLRAENNFINGVNGTPMWKLYVIQTAIDDVKDRLRRMG